MATNKERSDHIVQFVNSHPAINVAMLCRLAGGYDVSNFANAQVGNRPISKEFIPKFEKALMEYGFELLKEN